MEEYFKNQNDIYINLYHKYNFCDPFFYSLNNFFSINHIELSNLLALIWGTYNIKMIVKSPFFFIIPGLTTE